MCGILYRSNLSKKNLTTAFIDALGTLKRRGPDETGILIRDNYMLGHNRLTIIDKENGHQPLSINNTHLSYNGELYNLDELKLKVDEDSNSDTIVLLKLLNKYGIDIINELNGIFSFVYMNNDTVYAARDMFGVKPLYYSFIGEDIVIASEIKAILKLKGEAIVNKEGLMELLGMGPSHSQGKTIYKDIYEVKPGEYLKFQNGILDKKIYYRLKPYKYLLSYNDTVNKTRKLLDDAINRQLISDVGVSVFLSGGLDSSIISTVASKRINNLDAYNIEYENNEAKFNEYETSSDLEYARKVSKNIKCNLNECVIPIETLVKYLDDAVIAHDAPGMTDIDSSMLYLAESISKRNKVALSGECSDEIFGGYRWFYTSSKEIKTFPWIRNIKLRESLLKPDLKLDLEHYVNDEFNMAIKEVPFDKCDTELTKRERTMFYLNLKYFMTNLLDRNDRMLMYHGVESRVPFCDKRLVELLYNIPFKYKYRSKIEKKLLRDSYRDVVIPEVINRKKSPYPKSNSKEYSKRVSELVKNAIEKPDSILRKIFDIDKIKNLLEIEELDEPWYGQLMRKTSLLAYIYQIDYWGRCYNVKLEL